MRTLIVLAAGVILAGSAYATDRQASQSARSNVAKANVAVVVINQAAALRAAVPAQVPSKADKTDSRLDNYRLERESCCGPM